MPYVADYDQFSGVYEIAKQGDRTRILVTVNDNVLADKIVRGLNLVEQEEDEDRFTRALR